MRIVLILLLLCPAGAFAGAWPRGEGNVFWAYSLRTGVGSGRLDGIYVEAGLSDILSYGMELGRGDERTAMGSLTQHFAEPDAAWQYAAGLGYGVLNEIPTLRVHGNLGLGWELGEQSGWIAWDASAAFAEKQDSNSYKLDTTLGWNAPFEISVFGQVFLYWDDSFTGFHSVEAHVARPLNDYFSLDLGVHQSLNDMSQNGLALGVWADF